MSEKKLKIYTSKDCKYCDKLKIGLDTTNLEYINIDVDNPDNSNEVDKIFNLTGEQVIPIIIIQPHILAPMKSFNTIDEALELIIFLMK